MIQRLLQVRANLILCFRAEEKIGMEKNEKGKIVIVAKGFQPICSKEMPYELTVSFLLTPDRPGFPQPIKLQEQHKSLFPLDRQINEESGKRVSEWAAGIGAGVKNQPIPEDRVNKNLSNTHVNMGQGSEDIPTLEEEKQILEEKGMIPTDDKSKDEKIDEAIILNRETSMIAKFTNKKECNEYYQKNRQSLKKTYSNRFFFEWTKLVNDKLERLKV